MPVRPTATDRHKSAMPGEYLFEDQKTDRHACGVIGWPNEGWDVIGGGFERPSGGQVFLALPVRENAVYARLERRPVSMVWEDADGQQHSQWVRTPRMELPPSAIAGCHSLDLLSPPSEVEGVEQVADVFARVSWRRGRTAALVVAARRRPGVEEVVLRCERGQPVQPLEELERRGEIAR
jgi:hypothetical protein